MAYFAQPETRPLRNPLRQKLSDAGLDVVYSGAAGRHSGQPRSSALSSNGGFQTWTDVPPVGAKDPHVTLVPQKRHLYQNPTGKEFDSAGLVGGRAKVPPIRPFVWAEDGKRTWDDRPDRSARTLPYLKREQPIAHGVRHFHADHPPLSANPNNMASGERPPRAEGVRWSERAYQTDGVFQRSERPSSLRPPRGEGVRISRDPQGVPMRAKEMPIAWPAWPGYPPTRDAGGRAVDYALARYGGSFRGMPQEHADVRSSRQQRVVAADPKFVHQGMRCRHAGEYYY